VVVLVSQDMVWGAVVFVEIMVPSTRNSTWVTPMLSPAVADMVVVFTTVALVLGEVIDTVGGMMSGGVSVVKETMFERFDTFGTSSLVLILA